MTLEKGLSEGGREEYFLPEYVRAQSAWSDVTFEEDLCHWETDIIYIYRKCALNVN